MKILLNNNDLNEALYGVSNLGFVPTMGGLHKGHISLIKKSLKECKKTIVSIFLNPTQFNNKNDYKSYPQNNKNDLLILRKLKVDLVFLPKKKHIYNSIRRRKIKIHKKDKIMCAIYRKGHFEGVIDVMDRLTKIINPKKIYMGEKDFQQFYLVKNYIEKNYKSKVISCRTIRDHGKLALSTRNLLLNKKELTCAKNISKKIYSIKKNLTNKKDKKKYLSIKKRELNEIYNINIEYLDLRNVINLKNTNRTKKSKLFIAYNLNKVRLIDNF